MMAKLSLAAQIMMDSAAFRPWMKDFHIARFLPEPVTQCFSEVMAKLLLAELLMIDAAFHP